MERLRVCQVYVGVANQNVLSYALVTSGSANIVCGDLIKYGIMYGTMIER